MKRTYSVGGVEFIREEEQLRFRLSWPTLLLQTFLYLLLIPFIGYALAWPFFVPHPSPGFHVEPGALILGLLIETILIVFLVGRGLDRFRSYTFDLSDRSFRHGSLRLCSLDDISTITVVQRNRACSLEFALRREGRTVQALHLPSLKGASDAAKEIAEFLGMETETQREEIKGEREEGRGKRRE